MTPINSNFFMEQEKQDLELHIALSSQRFAGIVERLDKIEVKIDEFEALLDENRRNLATVIIGAAATISTGLFGLIITLVMKF